MFDLNGKTALITGAATGLGQAIAVALAKAGANVAISDRREGRLEETEALARSANRNVVSITLDVRDLKQIAQAAEELRQAFGGVDILVNNAGINRPASGLEVTPEAWEDHFNCQWRLDCLVN